MCSSMNVAVSPCPKILPALYALVRLFSSVRPLVSAKSELSVEGSVTDVTFKRLFTVRGFVSYQIGGSLEALVADIAAEASLVGVANLVVLQLLAADERLVAILALVGPFDSMSSHVTIETLRLFKAFATRFTHEHLDVAVNQLVLHHAAVLGKLLSTGIACVRLDATVAHFMSLQ